MIVVVADTSPLNYLIQIKCEPLLPALYGRVFVPVAVLRKLNQPGTPNIVRSWLQHLPEWMAVREVRSAPAQALAALGPGEREAIQLALEESADLLLIDEKLGVRLARERGLTVTGTLGILVHAAQHGLVEIDAALANLQATDFRCTPNLFGWARQCASESH